MFSQITQKVCEGRGVPAPPMPGFLSQLTRHGYRTPYHFALSRDLEAGSRVEVSEAFKGISEKLDRKADDEWNTIRQKLETVQLADMFGDISSIDFAAIFNQPSPETEG